MASILVTSLTRLYGAGKVTKEQVAERVVKGTISAEDYKTITGEVYEAPAEENQDEA